MKNIRTKVDFLKEWTIKVANKSDTQEDLSVEAKNTELIFRKLFPEKYFEIELVNNLYFDYQKSKKDKLWLLYRLRDCTNIASILLIFEVANVLAYFEKHDLEYLQDQLYIKKKLPDKIILKDFFAGNYHEMFVAYSFKKNGFIFDVNKVDPTIESYKPLDGILNIENELVLVECRSMESLDSSEKLKGLLERVSSEYFQQVSKIVSARGSNDLNVGICGFVNLEDSIDESISNFRGTLGNYFHKSLNSELNIANNLVSFGDSVMITGEQDEIYLSLPKEENSRLLFKFNLETASFEFELKEEERKLIDKILKEIKFKKDQHKKSLIGRKLIVLGTILEMSQGGRYNLEYLNKYRSEIENAIDDNTDVCILLKSIIKKDDYITVFCASKNNSIIERSILQISWAKRD